MTFLHYIFSGLALLGAVVVVACALIACWNAYTRNNTDS